MQDNPIVFLYDQIIQTFENVNNVSSIRLKEYNTSKLSRKVRIETGSFGLPKSDHKTMEIVLNEKFLIITWSIIYVILEVARKNSRITNKPTKTFLEIDGKIQKLDFLFDWAFSLKENCNQNWPKNLPNPTIRGNEAITVTNLIFIDAVLYIMYHEVAHLVNRHYDSFRPIKFKIDNNEELDGEEETLLMQLEHEADTFAFESLIGNDDNDEIKYHKQLGIILAGLTSLFMIKKGGRLSSITHPSSYVRLFNNKSRVELNEEENLQIGNVFNVGLCMFCKLYNINYEDKTFNNYDELLDYFFELLQSKCEDLLIPIPAHEFITMQLEFSN